MTIGIWTRWVRPVADNIVVMALLLSVGLALSLVAFFRGDRSTACKLSLAISVLLLVAAGAIALVLNASIRGIR